MNKSTAFGATTFALATLVALGATAAACSSGGGTAATGSTGAGGSAEKTSSSSTTTTGTGTGGATTGSTSSSTGATGTGTGGGAPFVPMCVPANGVVLAINNIEFGNDASAPWNTLGFNIDGKDSTASSTNLCQPADGASAATVYPDGDNGIDNSFGKLVLPILLTYDKTLTTDTNSNITAVGEFTVMLDFDGLVAGANQSPLDTKLYVGGQLGAKKPTVPKFDGSDCWPVDPEELSNPADITSSTIAFPTSTLTANHWDSVSMGTVPLIVPTSFGSITLTVHNAHLAMDLSADHKSGMNGVLGGVVDTQEFVAEVLKIVQNKGLCFLASTITTQITQCSDIMNDGTQDPTKTCNGISIGLGFTMKEVQLGGVGPAAGPPAPTCP